MNRLQYKRHFNISATPLRPVPVGLTVGALTAKLAVGLTVGARSGGSQWGLTVGAPTAKLAVGLTVGAPTASEVALILFQAHFEAE
jgi:hypothetical protein